MTDALPPVSVITEKLRRIRSGQAPRYMDLFAGCGGISLGFLTAGFQPVASVELDGHAARFCRNKEIEGDPYATCSVSTLIKCYG